MKKKLLTAITALVLCSFVTSQAIFAQESNVDQMQGPELGQGFQHQGHDKMRHQGNKMDFLSKLNLTQDQKNKLDKQKEASKAKLKDVRKQLITEHEKLMSLMFDPKSTKEQLYQQQEKVSAIKNQMEKARIDDIVAMKEILTPEQKEQLQQQTAEKMKQFKERMSKKGPCKNPRSTPCRMKKKENK